MYLRFKIFNHRIVIYNRRVYNTGGFNSNLPDGSHICMVDCDKVNLRDLETEAISLQENFGLGDCYIVSTGKADSYHLIFLTRLSWRGAVEVAASCQYTDLKHLQFSLRRGHFTLRLLGKADKKPYLTSIIKSKNLSDVKIKDLESFVLYETANK